MAALSVPDRFRKPAPRAFWLLPAPSPHVVLAPQKAHAGHRYSWNFAASFDAHERPAPGDAPSYPAPQG